MKAIAILLFLLNYQIIYGQYSISGFLITDKPEKTIYLSTLRYDELNQQYENQIITSTKTNTTGFFKISGVLLSKHDKLYRIYANISDVSLDFIRSPERKNYHNFIFSNNDTIFFPKNNDNFWFSNSTNTNKADSEWKNIQKFDINLKSEFEKTQNSEALAQSKKDYLIKFKKYIDDSIFYPLNKLLAYSLMKNKIGKLDNDFIENPDFYHNILTDLKNEYGETSYYHQFREETKNLSQKQLEKKYSNFKTITFILIFAILVLLAFIFKVIKNKNELIKENQKQSALILTQQEKKIIDLIIKGNTNKEISSKLFISLSTVKTHITNIYSKLNVRNRQDLMRKYKNHTGY